MKTGNIRKAQSERIAALEAELATEAARADAAEAALERLQKERLEKQPRRQDNLTGMETIYSDPGCISRAGL